MKSLRLPTAAGVVLILILVLVWICGEVEAQSSPKLKKLYQDLLRNHNPLIRPVKNESERVHIEVNFKLHQIVHVGIAESSLSTKYVLETVWYDYQLEWNPHSYDEITEIRIPSNFIWDGDIVVYNSFGQDHSDDESRSRVQPRLARVHWSGRVSISSLVVSRTQCSYDKSRFLFGTQFCFIKLGSWTNHYVDLYLKSSQSHGLSSLINGGTEDFVYSRDGVEFDREYFIENSDWRVLELSSLRSELYYTCCDMPFVDVRIHFKLKGRAGPFVATFVLPWIMITFLAPFTFLLSPDSCTRLSCSIIYVLLLMAAFAGSSTYVNLSECYNFTVVIAVLVLICSAIFTRLRIRSDSPPELVIAFIVKAQSYLLIDQRYHRSSIKEVEPTSTTRLNEEIEERQMSWKDAVQVLDHASFAAFSAVVALGVVSILGSGI